MTEAAPRIVPIPKEDWNDDALAVLRSAYGEQTLERFFSTGPDAMAPPNVLGTLLHHPTLAEPWLKYSNVLLRTPALEHRARELMVLRVAWRTRSRYEWLQHVKLASRWGIERDDIDAIARGVDADSWTPHERDLVAAADELIDHFRIADETWARLAVHLDERQLVELVFVVGTYTTMAMAFNSFRVQLEPDLDTGTVPLPD